jgi:hypothetical protein
MRPATVLMICGLLANATFGEPSVRVATTLPAVTAVTSLAELRALPPAEVHGWEVRVGIADGGRDAGPWKVLYCLAKPTEGTNGLTPGTIDELGPLTVDFGLASEGGSFIEKLKDQSASANRTIHKGDSLFARIIPLASKGAWELTVSSPRPTEPRGPGGSAPLFRTRFDIGQDVPLFWQQFATLERYQDERNDTRFRCIAAARPYAAFPQIDGGANLLPAGRPITAPGIEGPHKQNRLPCGLPLLGGWAEAITGKIDPKVIDVPPLTLSLVDGWFIVQSRGPDLIDWADQRLLARWWVNGEPMPAPLSDAPALKQARMLHSTAQMGVRFGLPATLGSVKPGDRVAMQVVYSPRDIEPACRQRQQQAQSQAILGQAACLLPSNRIEFVVTDSMLR